MRRRKAGEALLEGREYVLVKDGKYLAGVGYAGPGKAVPYWTEDIEKAKVWFTTRGVWMASERYGGKALDAKAEAAGKGKLPESLKPMA